MILQTEICLIVFFIQIFTVIDCEKAVVHFSPANSLNVDKMFYSNVFGSDVFTACAAAKGQ